MTEATEEPTGRWAGLAEHITAARTQLGLSTRALALRAGLDPRTLARVESGGAVQLRRLDDVDAALGWEPGASQAYLRGQVESPADYRPTVRELDDLELLLSLRRAAAQVYELSGELAGRLGASRRPPAVS